MWPTTRKQAGEMNSSICDSGLFLSLGRGLWCGLGHGRARGPALSRALAARLVAARALSVARALWADSCGRSPPPGCASGSRLRACRNRAVTSGGKWMGRCILYTNGKMHCGLCTSRATVTVDIFWIIKNSDNTFMGDSGLMCEQKKQCFKHAVRETSEQNNKAKVWCERFLRRRTAHYLGFH